MWRLQADLVVHAKPLFSLQQLRNNSKHLYQMACQVTAYLVLQDC